jgi:hypothetical protein
MCVLLPGCFWLWREHEHKIGDTMNENLLTLKQIADQIGLNYKTLLSCKDRLEEFIQGLPVGRKVKYSDKMADFFRLVFALSDEGYSTEKIRNLLLNGVVAKEDAFIESWLEEWRTRLRLNGGSTESEQKQADGLADRLTGGLTGPRPDPLTGWMTDGPTELLTDGLTDSPAELLTDLLADGPTHGLTDPPADRLTGPPADALTDSPTDRPTDGMTDRLTDKFQIMHDQAQQTLTQNLQAFTQSLTHNLQKMATQTNIAITALCEAADDIRTTVLNLDARLSRLEKDLDVEAADPLELYQVEAGKYQVDLPEISMPVFLDQDLDPDDDLTPVRDSISNGIPDKEMLAEWIIARREEDLQANSYSALAVALNEAEVPTMSGRANWTRSTVRNLVVRKKAEQG